MTAIYLTPNYRLTKLNDQDNDYCLNLITKAIANKTLNVIPSSLLKIVNGNLKKNTRILE